MENFHNILSGLVLVCGTPPRAPMLPMWHPHPFFSFSRKKKRRGRKEKALTHRRARKEHVKSRESYQTGIALASKGAVVRNSAYQTKKCVLFPRYERADAHSIPGYVPKLYNSVWSHRLTTLSPIHQESALFSALSQNLRRAPSLPL